MTEAYLGLPVAEIKEWRFRPGITPLSDLTSVVVALTVYFLIVVTLKGWIKSRSKPFHLRELSVILNAGFAVMSAILLYLLSHEMLALSQDNSMWSLLCDEGAMHNKGPHIYLLYIVYLTKFVELLDTVLLCLRGKETPVIHLYHHAVTVFFTYVHLHEQTCITWTMPIMNLFVHCFLYTYFALYDLGYRVWWKKYLTTMQIAQFYVMAVLSLVVLIPRILFTVDPGLPFAHPCHGSWRGTGIGIPLLLSYLVLFQRLYNQTYAKPAVVGSETAMTANAIGEKRATHLKVDSSSAVEPIPSDASIRRSTMWGGDVNASSKETKKVK